MADKPLDLTVEIAPKTRFDMVDLRQAFAAEHHALAAFPRCLYWSCHTTAGFLERGLASRLSAQHIPSYLEALRTIFPEGAGYEHDRLEARSDLDADQRAVEPRNADSHLAFMAGGLRTCVTHPNTPTERVFFVDLDGVNDGRPRQRRTRLIGFNNERQVASTRIDVPMSSHAVDSINLKDPEIGVYAQLLDFVRRSGKATNCSSRYAEPLLCGWTDAVHVDGQPVDAAFPVARVAVLASGWAEPVDPRHIEATARRWTALIAQGWTIIHVTRRDLVERPHTVLADICRHVARGPVTLGRAG